jgi:hypothetical protein
METLRPPLKEKSHKSAPKKPENQNQIHRRSAREKTFTHKLRVDKLVSVRMRQICTTNSLFINIKDGYIILALSEFAPPWFIDDYKVTHT